jgi:hypothetical protein
VNIRHAHDFFCGARRDHLCHRVYGHERLHAVAATNNGGRRADVDIGIVVIVDDRADRRVPTNGVGRAP